MGKRVSGEKLREKIIATYAAGTMGEEKIELDFTGLVIASTSFFDEGLAKLALSDWTYEDFKSRVTIKNMNPRDQEVLTKMLEYRGWKPPSPRKRERTRK
ncbi:STAS-like domain-containing protein [Bdellovibrionota bacterium FG-2]